MINRLLAKPDTVHFAGLGRQDDAEPVLDFRHLLAQSGSGDYFTSLCSQRPAAPASSDYPPSEARNITSPDTGRTLHLRQWAKHGETVASQPQKAPVVLLIHGLGGRSEWQAPLAEAILNAQNCSGNRLLVYSVELPRIAKTSFGEGEVNDIQDLVSEVRETMGYLAQQHGGSVYAVATSLGGLLVTDIAANPPQYLTGVSLLSPAYKPLATRGDRTQLKAAQVLRKTGLLDRVAPHLRRHDTKAQKIAKAAMPKGLTPLQQRIRKEKDALGTYELTIPSYLQVVDLMKKARTELVQNITLPVQVFITESDETVDPGAIKDAFRQMPNQPFKESIVYEKAEHDLVCDPALPDVADKINERLDVLLFSPQ